jgi:TrmH family RNA methyltransferase
MVDIASTRLRAVSSRQNSLVKELRQAFSQGQTDAGLCAIEGVRLIEEAIRSGLKIQTLFVRQSSAPRADRILDQIGKHADALLLPDEVFDSTVATEHSQGIAALIKVREQDLESTLATSPALILVAAAIQDPGNLGTLIRSSEAFGATGVVSIEGTANHWSAKTLRASAGSIFRLPVLKVRSSDLLPQLRSRDIRILALEAPNQNNKAPDGSAAAPILIQDCDLTRPCALFVGNEGAGLPRELHREIDQFVAIPQAHVESLNAGVAASIALYEAQRQRSRR